LATYLPKDLEMLAGGASEAIFEAFYERPSSLLDNSSLLLEIGAGEGI